MPSSRNLSSMLPMRRGLLFALIAAAGIFLLSRRAFATADPNAAFYSENDDIQPVNSDPSYWFLEDQSQIGVVNMGSPEQNLLAFLALIRKFESNGDYNILYGGARFDDFAQHPNQRIPIGLPGYEGKFSTAAGAYQFIYRTWANLAERLSLTDFSPASQDAAAVGLLTEIGAMPYIQRGEFDQALKLASAQWASLPYSPAKQNPKSIAAANEFLTRYLDQVA